jgi:hypothetical protein
MFVRTLKSTLFKGYDHIGFVMLANLIFVAASALIITIPITVLLLSALTGELSKGKVPDIKLQLKQAGKYFLKGGLLTVISIIITGILVTDCYFLLRIRILYPWIAHLFLGFILCLLAIWLLMQIYLIPMFHSQNLKIWPTLKKTFLIVIDNMMISIAFGSLLLAMIGLMLVTILGPFLLMFSLLFLMQNQIFVNAMEKYHGS